jgi:replication factor C large subunit
MDEIDGLSGTHDRGGLSEFIKIVQNSRYPIIGTANDPESNNIIKLIKRKEIRSYTFTRLSEAEIFELLLMITDAEQVDVNDSALDQLVSSSAGDIRAAINELESHIYGTSKIQIEERDKMRTKVDLLNDLFRAKDYKSARKALSRAPSDYYKLLLYLFDETVKQCKTSQEVATAYDQIAHADLVYSRIMRTQNWSLLKYFFDFIGPALNLARTNKQFKKIHKIANIPSSFISRGQSKNINSRALKIAPTVAPQLHISRRRFIHKEFRLFEKIILGNKGSQIAAHLNLDDDQISALSRNHLSSDLEKNIEDARAVVGKHRSESGKMKESTISGLDIFFNSPKSVEKMKDQEEHEEETSKQGQLSLDDFF